MHLIRKDDVRGGLENLHRINNSEPLRGQGLLKIWTPNPEEESNLPVLAGDGTRLEEPLEITPMVFLGVLAYCIPEDFDQPESIFLREGKVWNEDASTANPDSLRKECNQAAEPSLPVSDTPA